MKKLRTASFRQFAFAALLLASTVSFAQPANKQDVKQHGKHQQINRMQELNLTEDQQAQMKAANEDFKAQMKALKNDGSQTAEQQTAKKTALAQAHKAKLESLLTSEQKSKMAALKTAAKQEHGEMNAKHIERMQKELNLTADQANQLKSNEEAMKSQFESIKNNTNLDEATKRRQLAALKAERKATMEKVLTPEQKEKWQGMHKEQKGKMRKHDGKKNRPATTV